ncbi:hypothetical protein LCGC14_2731720 [marine sediment metagenome]|uniref:Uncharacterized protein n=1 Tax=marine sediment metagenome TaxID=412755 RepID=A0A0F9BG04_9ZZZZ
MEGTKKLTQVQKAYFIKRIDEITAQKMSEVRKTRVTVSQVRDDFVYYAPTYQIHTVLERT